MNNREGHAFYAGTNKWGRGAVYEGGRMESGGFAPAEFNNRDSRPIQISYSEPDLKVTSLTVPSGVVQSGQTVTVNWTVQNIGDAATYPRPDTDQAEQAWPDRVFLSRDESLDPSDWLLRQSNGSGANGKVLGIDESYSRSLDVRLPQGIDGDFYLIVDVDSKFTRARFPEIDGSGIEFTSGGSSAVDCLAIFRNDIVGCGATGMAVVQEFDGEADNTAKTLLPIELTDPPDLQVTSVVVPPRLLAGKTFDVEYTVSNLGPGDTPPGQSGWTDLIYLSRDPFLDRDADRYLGSSSYSGGLAKDQSYTATQSVRAPRNLEGPYYVIVITDPVINNRFPDGDVFELDKEFNNSLAGQPPTVIELPPPADLQVDSISIPPSGKSGEDIEITWSVTNHGPEPATGVWSDALYLSEDAIWDITDIPLGRAEFPGIVEDNATRFSMAVGETYTSTLTATLPPAKPGQYRVITRADIFDDVFEAENELNNQTASPGTISLTVDALTPGVPLETTLSTGQVRLYEVQVGAGETLRVSIDSDADEAANELFIRFRDVPNGIQYDAAYSGQLKPDQAAVIATTEPGSYYVLVRGYSQPEDDTPVRITAELLPFQVTDVTTDIGGDSRWVTTTIHGAKFAPNAIPKLVRPRFGEFEAVNYEVLDSTRILATFDLRDAPRGLYDVKVINPGGEEASLPYRYQIERAIEPDVSVGLGGPRVLNPGEVGTFSFSVDNRSNVDAPYVYFTLGVPELGTNPDLFGFRYAAFTSNLRGRPDGQAFDDVPWASLDSAITTPHDGSFQTDALGQITTPGVIPDLTVGDFAGLTFNVHTYPGLQELIDQEQDEFLAVMDRFYEALSAAVTDQDKLDEFFPQLSEAYGEYAGSFLDAIEPELVAFQFHILASAAAVDRDEFISLQTRDALALRDAVLDDPNATPALRVLAADRDTWTDAYLAALEEGGLLRVEDDVPPIRENPKVVSLAAVLSTGVLAGPVGEEIQTSGSLLEFFEQVRLWYGNDATLAEASNPGATYATEVDPAAFELNQSRPTHFQSFNIYVPFSNKLGSAALDVPPGAELAPPNFARFFEGTGAETPNASLVGPFGFGDQQFVPATSPLPYTIQFQNDAAAASTTNDLRVVTQLDDDVDVRSFQLGDLKLGDVQVHIPDDLATFQGDFDFIESKGFILRVTAGVDLETRIASWRLQAIDPATGELVREGDIGLLPPNDARGRGAGFVTYQVNPAANLAIDNEITASARVLLSNAPPMQTNVTTHRVDVAAPVTTVTSTPIGADGSRFEVTWDAVDETDGSGVKHVTVYVAQDGGDFAIWQRQSTEASGIYVGDAGSTYEFLALATDQAGNQESPRLGTIVPGDGSQINLGTTDRFDRTTAPLPPAPKPVETPSTNELFLAAQSAVPSAGNTSEFGTVLNPFAARRFASGIPTSEAGIGPMAIAAREDGTTLISGGLGRNFLYEVSIEGGSVGNAIAELSHPIFDLEFAPSGGLWATTGGGPLLLLNAETGAVEREFGEGITQTLAIDPSSGDIFVSTSRGVDRFDPISEMFTPFSDLRIGNLTFDPEGTLWGATWPNRETVVRFAEDGTPEPMLDFDIPIDSLTFG
ncbi:CARDB domain-containing protein, partial [Stieleria sp.]|uniref:CARDB domain-containing protein n=1 Tax=Stieleria sp. TaxID=2795976 RepID=UPI00356AB6DE